MISFLKNLWTPLDRIDPVRLMTIGYLSYVLFGWGFLSLPICHTATGKVTSLAALFTATSAVSTTGLATVSVNDDFNLLGQIVILLLIQLGGIGYMTFSSFICLSRGTSLSQTRQEVGKVVFSIPNEFRIDKFIRSVLKFSLVIEAIGALVLFFPLQRSGVANPLWSAIFHSVSAFCTAGFSLYNNSFEGFRDNVSINVTLGVLSYAGAIGFIVFVDCWRWFVGKTERITLTSKIILTTTLWIMVLGTFLIFIAEPSIRSLPPWQRLTAAWFQVMTASTTVGFNTLPIGGLSPASLLLIIILMVVGASPAGTGGGIKTTTFSAMFGIIKSVIQKKEKVMFYNREIPEARLRAATAGLGFYVFFLFAGCYFLALTESQPFLSLFFEVVSALGTVGLSTGITSSLTPLGQVILVLIMFIGRVGPIAFGIALFFHRTPPPKSTEDLAV